VRDEEELVLWQGAV